MEVCLSVLQLPSTSVPAAAGAYVASWTASTGFFSIAYRTIRLQLTLLQGFGSLSLPLSHSLGGPRWQMAELWGVNGMAIAELSVGHYLSS